jgi:hypothetical protein
VALCKILTISDSQELGNPTCLVTVTGTGKDKAQQYKGKRFEFSEPEEWKQKGPYSAKGKEKKSIDRKRVFAAKVEGIYNGTKEGSFKEEGEPSVRQRGLWNTVR